MQQHALQKILCCSVAHTTQKNFQEMEEESSHCIKFMKVKVAGRDTCDIINTDQTPILYSFLLSKMLETKRSKTIHVFALIMDTTRVMLAVTIDASEKILLPIFIFKGAWNGHVTLWHFLIAATMHVKRGRDA